MGWGVAAGGSKLLTELIDEHGEALVSDFLAYYRLDLRGIFTGELSPRYVMSLIRHLPDDGAFYASMRGGQQFRGWNVDRYALVSQVNAQRANNHILLMVNRDPKRSAPKPPDPFPTPDLEEERTSNKPKPGSFAAIAASMLAAQRRKREQANGG